VLLESACSDLGWIASCHKGKTMLEGLASG
jgi:hypothetical protein